MRILVRTSKWSIWARRLGSFALPLAIIPVFMHRARTITSETFEVTEAVAIGVALLAFLLSIGAFARIWTTGDRGWGRAVTGLALSLICLAPVAFGAVQLLRYPMANDVSTDAANPPPLVSSIPMPPPPTAAELQKLATVFPNIKTRRYPIGAVRTYDLVSKLIEERGWDVRLRRQPETALDGGQINAIATTLLGWRDEVSIRIDADAQGVSVAMRSASLSPVHEPGVNGSRIEEFLTALDARVTLQMRDQPAGALTPDADAEPASPGSPVLPAPARPPKK
jgi:hypothetical protein